MSPYGYSKFGTWKARKDDGGRLARKIAPLGVYCMELDYQRARELALPKHGVELQREAEIGISHVGILVTKHCVDFLIWNGGEQLLLETKARSSILPEDVEQCLLYLHRGGYRLCLPVNFGQKPLGVRRFVHTPKPPSSQ